MPDSTFSFRRCVLLCLPALIVGAILRIAMVAALPEGFYGPDSNSYFSTAKRLYNEDKWSVGEKRRWAYPVILAALPPLPSTPSRIIPIVQHLAGLAGLIAVGWITGHITRRRALWVPLVTTLVAVSPLLLWYEQEVQAEALFASAYMFAVAAFFPVQRLKEGRRLMWFLLAAAFVVALKPHGRGIWVACLVAALLVAGVPWRWKWRDLAAAAVGLLVIVTSGSSRQGNSLLLSSVLPLVPLEGEKWPAERAVLAPFIQEARANLAIYPWKQNNYKRGIMTDKIGASLSDEWAAIAHDKPHHTKVCATFVREAMRAHPFEFAYLSIVKCALGFAHTDAPSRLLPRLFWKEQVEENEGRWKKNPRELELFYGFDRARFDAIAADGAQRTFWPHSLLNRFSSTAAFTRDGHEISRERYDVWPTALGWITLAGLLCTLWRFRELTVLWLPLTLYLGSVFGVGDRLDRYVQPVEWLGFVLAALALDTLLTWLLRFRSARLGEDDSHSQKSAAPITS